MEENMDRYEKEVILDRPLSMAKNFVANVFSWMFLGLVITGVVSWFGASTGIFAEYFMSETGPNILGWCIMLAPLVFIIAMNAGLQKFSAGTLVVLFIAFAAIMGLSLSWIFYAFSLGSIVTIFFVSAAIFGLMAVVGYTTNQDLTKFGSLMFMGLIGIIIASVINWFIGSAMMDYIISIIGVLVFVGLTAYDTQKIKRIGAGVEYGSQEAKKLAILGATSLYLDFINLFLFLLRLFGSRD